MSLAWAVAVAKTHAKGAIALQGDNLTVLSPFFDLPAVS